MSSLLSDLKLCNNFLSEITAAINCDDNMTVYGDGIEIGKGNGLWLTSQRYNFSRTTKVVAIKGVNFGGLAGIIGSFSNRLLTDGASWRCTNKLVTGWNTAGFDDSSWPAAVVESHPAIVHGPKVAAGAKWIWTDSVANDMIIYCRAEMGK